MIKNHNQVHLHYILFLFHPAGIAPTKQIIPNTTNAIVLLYSIICSAVLPSIVYARIIPISAILNVCPNSRTVEMVDDAKPMYSFGTELIIRLLFGGAKQLTPIPTTAKLTIMIVMLSVKVPYAIASKPTPMNTMPQRANTAGLYRSDSAPCEVPRTP